MIDKKKSTNSVSYSNNILSCIIEYHKIETQSTDLSLFRQRDRHVSVVD